MTDHPLLDVLSFPELALHFPLLLPRRCRYYPGCQVGPTRDSDLVAICCVHSGSHNAWDFTGQVGDIDGQLMRRTRTIIDVLRVSTLGLAFYSILMFLGLC